MFRSKMLKLKFAVCEIFLAIFACSGLKTFAMEDAPKPLAYGGIYGETAGPIVSLNFAKKILKKKLGDLKSILTTIKNNLELEYSVEEYKVNFDFSFERFELNFRNLKEVLRNNFFDKLYKDEKDNYYLDSIKNLEKSLQKLKQKVDNLVDGGKIKDIKEIKDIKHFVDLNIINYVSEIEKFLKVKIDLDKEDVNENLNNNINLNNNKNFIINEDFEIGKDEAPPEAIKSVEPELEVCDIITKIYVQVIKSLDFMDLIKKLLLGKSDDFTQIKKIKEAIDANMNVFFNENLKNLFGRIKELTKGNAGIDFYYSKEYEDFKKYLTDFYNLVLVEKSVTDKLNVNDIKSSYDLVFKYILKLKIELTTLLSMIDVFMVKRINKITKYKSINDQILKIWKLNRDVIDKAMVKDFYLKCFAANYISSEEMTKERIYKNIDDFKVYVVSHAKNILSQYVNEKYITENFVKLNDESFKFELAKYIKNITDEKERDIFKEVFGYIFGSIYEHCLIKISSLCDKNFFDSLKNELSSSLEKCKTGEEKLQVSRAMLKKIRNKFDEVLLNICCIAFRTVGGI